MIAASHSQRSASWPESGSSQKARTAPGDAADGGGVAVGKAHRQRIQQRVGRLRRTAGAARRERPRPRPSGQDRARDGRRRCPPRAPPGRSLAPAGCRAAPAGGPLLSKSGGASLPRLRANAISAFSRSIRARLSSSSGSGCAEARSSAACSNAPAWSFSWAAETVRCARSVGSLVSATARPRKAAAAATPPRARALSADRSSSAATPSSGPDAALARCHTRRSGSFSASVASASTRCTPRCSDLLAAR